MYASYNETVKQKTNYMLRLVLQYELILANSYLVTASSLKKGSKGIKSHDDSMSAKGATTTLLQNILVHDIYIYTHIYIYICIIRCAYVYIYIKLHIFIQ